MTEPLDSFLHRAEVLLSRLEGLLPPAGSPADTQDPGSIRVWRWRRDRLRGRLEAVIHPRLIRWDDIQALETQKRRLWQNTLQFVAGKPANNTLLTGARGTGKSSLVRALLTEFGDQGLRLVEVDKSHLVDLPEILGSLEGLSGRFILFCDDLSFEAGEGDYKALKSALDGSLCAPDGDVLIYATSNRRHLLPEQRVDNDDVRHEEQEIHPGDGVEEKLALSDRFGLWLTFYSFDQDDYLRIAHHWANVLGGVIADRAAFERAALQWALTRGARNGRTALHFARDWVGSRETP